MFNTVRTGNYSQSAKAVVGASDQIFDAAMSSKPDFTKIAKEAIKGRSLERREVMKAEQKVASAGLSAFTDVTRTKNDIESKKRIADIKRPAKRMAGIVGGLGAIAGGYVLMEGNKKDKAERDAFRAEQGALLTKQEQMQSDLRAQQAQWMEQLTNSIGVSGGSSDPKPSTPAPSGAGSTVESSDPKPAKPTPVKPTKSTAVKPTTVKGIRGDVYNYLTGTKGLSRNKALGLMANIDRESSFQINPQGGDNGNSFGMFQWNNTYGRSDIMKKNVSDWQTNWKGQIDHALGGSQLPEYNKVTNDFLNTTFDSPQAAADYWMQRWERPAHQERDSKRHTEFLSGYNF